MESNLPLTKTSTERVPFLTSLRKPLFDLFFCSILWFLGANLSDAFGIRPVEVGFFCNDESIRRPRLPEIISGSLLYVYTFGVVCTCIILVELYCLIFVDSGSELASGEAGHNKIKRYLLRVLTVFSYFMIAFAVVYIATTVAKKTVGRLRPRFIDVCKPDVDIIACSNEPIFITDYQCTSGNEKAIQDGRLSFFSGHSSYSMTAATFSTMYIYARLSGALFSQAALPLIQMGLMSSGLVIGWTRYVDHSHHWSDVFTGQVAGVIIAYLIVAKIAKMFPTRKFI